ncbi:hypothetical protein COO59_05905 [Mixta theicola]|uniref:Uncharacterized protein n=1 Tax=Mixta theicola TaxID=1458355 RepID=A0A2K1QC84_9GAMM|nr:hypothetical protein COO59_05905 [Mixta theicola]
MRAVFVKRSRSWPRCILRHKSDKKNPARGGMNKTSIAVLYDGEIILFPCILTANDDSSVTAAA